MAKTKFKVGDRVCCLVNKRTRLKGKEGIIKFIDNIRSQFAVEFFDYTDGYACQGHCKSNQGCWLDASEMKKVSHNNNKIIIYAQGNTVTAKLMQNKECIAHTIAKCSPDDNFDLLIGAQLALQRLAKQQNSKYVISLKAFNDKGIEII